MTFPLALLGVILASSSLGWQVYTWRHNGPRIVVKANFAWPTYGPNVGDQHIGVTAANRGRAAATIKGWGFTIPGGDSMHVPNPPAWSTRCPHRLDPQESADFFVPFEEIDRACSTNGVALSSLRAFVTLATGERKVSKKGLRT